MDNKKTIEIDEQTYNTLFELINSSKILQDYLNDQVIQDLAKHLGTLSKTLNAVSSTDLVDILERGLQDPQLDKDLLNPPKIGLVGLLKSLGNEDAQRGLGIFISFLKAIGKASREMESSKK